jgi:hypothetical protein
LKKQGSKDKTGLKWSKSCGLLATSLTLEQPS